MKLLPKGTCSKDQLAAIAEAEAVLNSREFKSFFIVTPFTEMGEFETVPKSDLYTDKIFNKEVTFYWVVVSRPWYKRFSSAIGWSEGSVIYTYANSFAAMTKGDRAGHIAHELMHSIGFTHSFNPSPIRAKSLPYMVGDYVAEVVNKK